MSAIDSALFTGSAFTADGLLLSRVLDAASLFVLYSGTSSPQIRLMRQVLIEMLLVTKLHQQSIVRRSTILALIRVLESIQSQTIAEELVRKNKRGYWNVVSF